MSDTAVVVCEQLVVFNSLWEGPGMSDTAVVVCERLASSPRPSKKEPGHTCQIYCMYAE